MKTKMMMSLILISGLSANANEMKGNRCTINTYSTACDVQTGCFDDDSFTTNTKKILFNELRVKGFKMVSTKKDPEFYRSEFMVELKYRSGKVSLRLFGPTELSKIGVVFLVEASTGNDLNEQALKLIQQLPNCSRQ